MYGHNRRRNVSDVLFKVVIVIGEPKAWCKDVLLLLFGVMAACDHKRANAGVFGRSVCEITAP